jgi:hypothetical protein
MFSLDPFYNSTLRQYIVAFGDMFSNLAIVKTNENDPTDTTTIRLPINFGQKSKIISRLTQRNSIDPDVTKIMMTAPRMGYDIKNIIYDPSRQLNNTRKLLVDSTDITSKKYVYQRVPYNIDFELSIWVKQIEEGIQAVEQIFPFFAPQYNITLKNFPGAPDSDIDVPVILTNFTMDAGAEGPLATSELIEFTLTFQMRAWFYGPVQSQNIIRHVIVTWVDQDHPQSSMLEKYDLKPNPLDADPNSSYGYTETITDS